MSTSDFIKVVIAAAKTKQWYAFNETLDNGQHIALKGFGLWIQRLETQGYTDSVGEHKTQKAFKAELLTHIGA